VLQVLVVQVVQDQELVLLEEVMELLTLVVVAVVEDMDLITELVEMVALV
tara:strand:- start:8 stop:157 length:150 start_codon:yes stop_codon:yes gene_type:complete